MEVEYKEYRGKFVVKEDNSGFYGSVYSGPLFDSGKHVVTFQTEGFDLNDLDREFRLSVDDFIEWETSGADHTKDFSLR